MTNYREILRLSALGLNKTEIAQSLQCSRTTVRTVLRIVQEERLDYSRLMGMSNKQLFETLYPATLRKPTYKIPNFEYTMTSEVIVKYIIILFEIC